MYGMIVPQVRFAAPGARRHGLLKLALVQEGAAWAKDKDAQEATAKGDWLGKKSLG